MTEEEPVELAMTLGAVADRAAPPIELDSIFRAHHEAVFRAAWRITGNASDAEDVLQVVFLRLLRREGQVELSETTGSYLHRAAVNAALDVLRRRRTARATPLDELAETLPDPSEHLPERRRADGEMREALRDALVKLSPRAAEVFTLRYVEGWDNWEIARMLGMPRVSVAVSLHRTRLRLRKDLERFAGGSR